MTALAPLTDDWLFWDPQSIDSYPHSCTAESLEPQQLDLFEPPSEPPEATTPR